MDNISIPSGRGLILSGNRPLAARFVKISQRRLMEMKQIMKISGQTMMQRMFYLDRDCVWVRMHVIGNAEFIRIHACSEGANCSLKMSLEALGGKQVEITATHDSDETSPNYIISYDVNGPFMTGGAPPGIRYASSNLVAADLGVAQTKTLTFLNTGTYTIDAFAQPNQNLVTHSSGIINVPEYEVDMDLTGISNASVFIEGFTVDLTDAEIRINDVLVGITLGGDYYRDILVRNPAIQDTMNIKVTGVTANIRTVTVIFRPYSCQAIASKTIEVT
jgi:hypothetical protein